MLATLSILVSTAAPGAAQDEPTPAKRAFDAGVAAEAAGQPDEACRQFRAALELERAVGPLSRAGRCDAREGKIKDATAKYEELLGKLPPENPRRAEYEAELAGFRAKLGRITLELAPGAAGVTATIDGAAAPAWGSPSVVDPGPHVVAATESGDSPVEQRIDVAPGKSVVVRVPFESAAAPRSEGGPSGWMSAGIASFAVGGAAAIAAAVTGGLIIARDSDAKERCIPSPDNAPCQESIDAGEALLAPNMAMWIIGAIGVGAGVTFVIVDAATGDDAAPPRAALELFLRPTGLGVQGAF